MMLPFLKLIDRFPVSILLIIFCMIAQTFTLFGIKFIGQK